MDDDTSQFPVYYGPSYGDLPMEILLQIFDYLNPTDIKEASLVCQRWNEASQSTSCESKLILRFYKTYLADTEPPLATFLKSNRKFTSIMFEQTDFGKITGFLEKFGKDIEEITFYAVDMSGKQFREILQNLERVRKLSITNCSALFMAGQLLDFDAADQLLLSKALYNVKSLTLQDNRYLTDAVLHRITAMIPNIEILDLSQCQIAFHHSLCRRFYPSGDDHEPSESIQTFRYVLKLIESHAKTLRELNLSHTLFGNSATNSIIEIENLALEKLALHTCLQLTRIGLCHLVNSQKNLKYLDLSNSGHRTDSCIELISQQIPQLEVLKLSNCKSLTDVSIEHISKMKKLKILDLSECYLLTNKQILDKTPNKNMKELYLKGTNVSEEFLIGCTEYYPNLKVLDIGSCHNSVTDAVLQSTIKNLPHLRVLSVEFCRQITDAALTAIELSDSTCNAKCSDTKDKSDEHNVHQRSRSVEKEERIQNSKKISLRSKAEQDIIDDANRKKLMLALCEQELQIDKNIFREYSISRLQGLQSLNLRACSRISDVSLIYGLKFRELKRLNLSSCQQISSHGMQYLVKSCPSIEDLRLVNCHNIDDKTIEVIAKGFKRLTSLVINGCSKLTDHSLDYITVNCLVLKYLSVRGCRSMCSEPYLRLTTLASLRMVHSSNGTIFR